MNKSIMTLSSPEFININSISPMISKCDVKVLYIGQNRNHSSISKEVAEQMAQTLPGCPIVGYYIENKEDFGDHGDQMIIDGEGVHFNKLTKPYGFVPIEARVWFQDFEDIDEFGNSVIRKYLMTEGYLWTGQFEECQRVIDCGNPQSMELDDKTLKGHWAEDSNRGIDFFIINDATISKLCILGEDVEPCFQGASVTSPTVSSTFTKLDGKDDFSHTLFTMLKELRELKNNKGGYSMEKEQINASDIEETVITTFDEAGDAGSESDGDSNEAESVEAAPAGEEGTTPTATEDTPATEVINSQTVLSSEVDEACTNVPKKAEYAKEETEDEKKKESAKEEEDKDKKFEKKEEEEKKEAPADDKSAESTDSKDKDDKSASDENDNNKEEENKKKYALLEQEYNELKSQFSLLETEVKELRQFKNNVEDAKKDELINSFYMLSEEDKKDVVENKAKYSLDDIEAKLSVICVRKKVNFNLEEEKDAPATSEAPITFNLDAAQAETLPAWLQAVQNTKNRNN